MLQLNQTFTYSGTPLIRSLMGKKKMAVLTGCSYCTGAGVNLHDLRALIAKFVPTNNQRYRVQ